LRADWKMDAAEYVGVAIFISAPFAIAL